MHSEKGLAMRSFKRRNQSAVALATLLFVTSASTTSGIASERPPLPDGADRAGTEAPLSSFRVAEPNGILAWQSEVARIAPEIERTLDDNFGGVWFDTEDPEVLYVGVADADPRRTADRVRDLVPEEAGVTTSTRVVSREFSLEDLTSTFDAVTELIQSSAVIDGPNFSAEIDEATNRVEVFAPTDGAATPRQMDVLREITSRFSDRIRVVRDDTVIVSDRCSGDYCDQPLRAGVGLGYNPSSGGSAVCTAGFFARSRSDNALYLMTAGHCLRSRGGAQWFTRQPSTGNRTPHNIGTTHNYAYGLDGDIGIIRVTNPNWTPRQWVYVRAVTDSTTNTAREESYSIRAVAAPLQGQRVCMAGITTDTRCGTVNSGGVSYVDSRTGVTISNVVRANYCAEGGDSGGPVFSANSSGQRTAWGIHSGSARDEGLCGIKRSYFTPLTGSVVSRFLNVRIPVDAG